MKTDFEYQQQQICFANWRKSYEQLTDSSLDIVSDVPDITYTYKTHSPRAIKPLSIADQNLPSLLKISHVKTHIFIDSKTFYIKDIRDLKDIPFNTMVFSLDEPPLVTTEVSRTIMERYFKQKPLHYNFIQYIGKSIGIHQRCPFVSGHEIFIPERGSAHDSTSWYAAHHIHNAIEDKKANQMQVFFRQRHELQLNISAHSFNEQIERSAILSHMQHAMVDELISLYRDTKASHCDDELNIVEKRLKQPMFVPVRYALKKLVNFVAHYRLNEYLEKIFGEKSPFIDDFRATFLKKFKKDPPRK